MCIYSLYHNIILCHDTSIWYYKSHVPFQVAKIPQHDFEQHPDNSGLAMASGYCSLLLTWLQLVSLEEGRMDTMAHIGYGLLRILKIRKPPLLRHQNDLPIFRHCAVLLEQHIGGKLAHHNSQPFTTSISHQFFFATRSLSRRPWWLGPEGQVITASKWWRFSEWRNHTHTMPRRFHPVWKHSPEAEERDWKDDERWRKPAHIRRLRRFWGRHQRWLKFNTS